jgi:hypothetical protein
LERKLFEMAHTRVKAQKEKMEKCIELGICPFCWENLKEWHDAPVLEYGKFWAITGNDYPYNGSRCHYLAIYRDHISSIFNIPPGAGDELLELFVGLSVRNNIKDAAILMRFGKMIHTGATINHLHAHLVSGASREEAEKVSEIKYPDSFITSVLGYKMPKPK